MESFFTPRRLAIAGASNAEDKLGHRVMRRLLASRGLDIVPIHPRERRVLGVPACPDLASVGGHIDLLVALVPGERLLPLIEGAREGQVSYLLAISSGFAEASARGVRLQARLVAAAARRGIRVVGPNSMGMLNAAGRLNASLVPDAPPGGTGLSCITQSGGFGIATSMYALDHRLPVAKICDLGNTSDVAATDVLAYLADDPRTSVVGLYLEAPGDADALLEAAADLARRKPVILTTPGRTEAGRRASLAHLGVAAPSTDSAPRAAGALIRAATGHELLDIAKASCWQFPPRGPRVAILTATGGIGSELADLCVDAGFTVPALSDPLRGDLAALLPPFAAVGNPVDITPIYREFADVYPAVMRRLLDAEEIDLLIVALTDVATTTAPLARAIADEAGTDGTRAPRAKPIYVFWGSRDDALANQQVLESARLPCYRSTTATVVAAAAQLRHGAALARTRR